MFITIILVTKLGGIFIFHFHTLFYYFFLNYATSRFVNSKSKNYQLENNHHERLLGSQSPWTYCPHTLPRPTLHPSLDFTDHPASPLKQDEAIPPVLPQMQTRPLTKRSRHGSATDSFCHQAGTRKEQGLCSQCRHKVAAGLFDSSPSEVREKGGSHQRVPAPTPPPCQPRLLTLRGACATRSFRRQWWPGLARNRAPADTSRDAPSRKRWPTPSSSSP